ncbi:sigma-70 family RNA polymerase sigma factor [Alienimonas californiensis]|uniref:RNA polymerase sigma factor n=1 Tax=Alienimonas californiensis TaxID=2527989 RepID=A0A517PA17_9PLAN|nr:sigma-70 family RNA polymerase sigma factor [Alienimonas californiensis]QDT16205.1 RNA polymerase sigma factor [Alienimonas californiensis]
MTDAAARPLDDGEFVRLLTDSQVSLRSYLRVLMPGHPAAADVFQQANAKLWERRTDFQAGTDFKAWAMTLLKYEVLTARKREARERLRFTDDLEATVADELATFEPRVDDRAEALRACLGALPTEKRDLLAARYGADETLAEYAERAKRSLGGLRVTLHRVRAALAECVERRLAGVAGGER